MNLLPQDIDFILCFQLRNVLQSFNLFLLTHFFADQENTQVGQHNKLLVGFLTTDQNSVSADTGQIFLEDASGAVALLVTLLLSLYF